MQTIDVTTVWYRHVANIGFLFYLILSPTLKFWYLKIPTFESQRASVASILCLPSSYQELEIK